jgi:DnaJ-class molecular chaperone
MTRHERIEKQEFLLNARAGNFEALIVCPRCDGWGHEDVDLPGDEPKPCQLCKGHRVVKRRVTVVVEDTPVITFRIVRGI